MIINLDVTLKKYDLPEIDVDSFNEGIRSDNTKTVRDCINGQYRHNNYLSYLQTCWSKHYGVIISPDIIWQLVLSEISGHIKNHSEDYRYLFTKSDDKVKISVPTADPELIDLNLITKELKKLVPTNIDIFIPEFTTTTQPAKLAFMATFADAMTPYYNYSMYCCGIPKVSIIGDKEDWDKISLNLTTLKDILYKSNIDILYKNNISNYINNVLVVINNISSQYDEVDEDFIKDIFKLVACGSGGQTEAYGWITDLFIKKPRLKYVHNFPTCVAKVPYTFLETGQKFELCHGLFSSNEVDGYLIPEFGFIINEVE
jgi:hypothetical protein